MFLADSGAHTAEKLLKSPTQDELEEKMSEVAESDTPPTEPGKLQTEQKNEDSTKTEGSRDNHPTGLEIEESQHRQPQSEEQPSTDLETPKGLEFSDDLHLNVCSSIASGR